MSRACSGRAQSARFARARTEPPRRTAALATSRPWPLLACRAAPCTRPLANTLQASPGALQRRGQSLWRHAGVGSKLLPRTAPPKPPARASCPCEQLELILEPVGTHSSPPRRPTATERRSPAFLSTAAAGPASNAYKRRPRAPPSAQATSGLSPSAPLAVD